VAEEPLQHLTLAVAIEVPLPAVRARTAIPPTAGATTAIAAESTAPTEGIVRSLPHENRPTDVRCG
jgi:hypothetical protein